MRTESGFYTVSDPVHGSQVCFAPNAEEAKRKCLVVMFGCPLADVDASVVAEHLNELEVKRHSTVREASEMDWQGFAGADGWSVAKAGVPMSVGGQTVVPMEDRCQPPVICGNYSFMVVADPKSVQAFFHGERYRLDVAFPSQLAAAMFLSAIPVSGFSPELAERLGFVAI